MVKTYTRCVYWPLHAFVMLVSCVEDATLNSLVREKEFAVQDVPRGGNYLFSAVKIQLENLGIQLGERNLRARVVEHLQSRPYTHGSAHLREYVSASVVERLCLPLPAWITSMFSESYVWCAWDDLAQLRIPTWFLTLSAVVAKCHPDSMAPSSLMKMSNQCHLKRKASGWDRIQALPVFSQHFLSSVSEEQCSPHWWPSWLCHQNWVPNKSQSPHAHTILWIKDAPKLNVDTEEVVHWQYVKYGIPRSISPKAVIQPHAGDCQLPILQLCGTWGMCSTEL